MPDWGIWTSVAIGFFIAETVTTNAVFLCLGLACITTAMVAVFVFSAQWQLGFFALAAIVLFFVGRPFILRYLYSSSDGVKTNIEALIGKTGRVTEDVGPDEKKGRVVAGGDDWRAVSADKTIIVAGTAVIVVGMESSTLYVRAQ